MKKILLPLAISAAMGTAATAATINVGPGVVSPPITGNLFDTNGALDTAFGGSDWSFGTLNSVTTGDEGPGGETFDFWEIGAESGFNNTFAVSGASSGGGSITETGPINWDGTLPVGPADISATYASNLLLDKEQFKFTSNGSAALGVFGQDPLGVFYKAGVNFVILAFDDQIQGDDDNHDDYLILVRTAGNTRINEIPVPASALLLGGAIAGLGFARRRKQKKS